MTNPLTVMSGSPLPEGTKVATATQEILRRLKASSLDIEQREMEEILITLMDDLNTIGYSEEWREKVLMSSMVGYMRLLDKVAKEETPRNRKGKATFQNRR